MNNGYNGSNITDALLLKRNVSNYITGTKKRECVELLNRIDYVNELQHILTLFCSRFKWDISELNVPNTYIDNALFFNSFVAFYKSPEFGWIVLPATPLQWNIYGEPIELLLQGFNYEKKVAYSVNRDDVILFSDNRSRENCFSYFSRLCAMVSDMGRGCEVYANAMKSPTMIPTTFDKKKSAEQIVLNISTNDPYILLDERFFPSNDMGEKLFKQFNMPHTGEGLKAMMSYKKSLYEDMLTRLGIDVTAVRKEAQVTDDEANKNDLLCRIMLSQAYECRKEAVDKMTELSGMNITCEKIEPLEERDNAPLQSRDDIGEVDDER